MGAWKKLIATSTFILAMAGVIAAGDATSAAVLKLKANLGSPAGFEVDEVRVTDIGVACINYHVSGEPGAKGLGYAVVKDDKVLRSSADYERFEKVWNEHCLGPRGGGDQ